MERLLFYLVLIATISGFFSGQRENGAFFQSKGTRQQQEGLPEGKVGKAGGKSEKAEVLQHSREWEATGMHGGRYRARPQIVV